MGDPPRQIEDPQSPPCVPYWEGDNGGSTWKGVDRNEIRVVVPGNFGDTETAARFFNRRFEFYGRRLVVMDTEGEQGSSPEEQTANAADADEFHQAFASTHNGSGEDTSFSYSTELARRGLLYVTHESPFGQEYLRQRRPHVWQYPMEADVMFANMGEWTCTRLAGDIARFAGDPLLRSEGRVFGAVLRLIKDDFPLTLDTLKQELAKCGEELAFDIAVDANSNPTSNILRMREAGVTTVFCFCHFIDARLHGTAATSQGYFPEWATSTYFLQDSHLTMRLGQPSEQRAAVFGVQFLPKQVRISDLPAYWARKEVDPGYVGSTPEGMNNQYRALLLLASGIQMAGPNLTPATFEQALHRTTFPNPDHPIAAGKVGFQGNSYGMTIDGIEFWWSEQARNPYDGGNGVMCYVSNDRHSLGAWTQGDDAAFFQGPCDTGA